MDNGDRAHTRQYPTGEVVSFAPNSIVTPEDYRTNLERLQRIKAALTFYEEQNNQGLQRYYEERQMLEASVEQGRLAAQRLEQLTAGTAFEYGMHAAPAVPIAGPSNGAAPQQLPSYQARPPAYNEVEVPTSARIVEITSPQVDSHAASGPSRLDNNFYQSQSQQRNSQQPQMFHPHQYTNGVPHASGSSSNPRSFTRPTSNAQTGTQQMQYQSGSWYQNVPNSMYDSRGVPQVQQPAFVPYAPPSVAVPPSAPQPANPQNFSRHAQSNQAPSTSYQPRYGASTASSLDGALGSSSGSAPQSVPHAKVTYSSRASQSSMEAPQPSNPPPQSDNIYQERQLFAFFQSLTPAIVQQLMVQVLTVVGRIQSGKPKTAAEEEVDNLLDAKMRQASEVIAGRLKQYSVAEIKKIFVKYLQISKTGHEQAETYSASIRDAKRAGDLTAAQPTAQPVPTAPMSQTATAQSRSAPSSPFASSTQSSTAIPSTSSTTTTPSTTIIPSITSVPSGNIPSSSALQTSASRRISAKDHPQLVWYVPRDPSVPIAYRDGNGNIRYVFRPQQVLAQPSAPSVAADMPAIPSFVHNPSAEQSELPQVTTVELPGTPEPVEIRPPSEWSPEKADRRRLAQDIMRSLGRPRGSFGEPLRSISGSPVLSTNSQSAANGKRKSPPSPRPSTPLKKHRTDELAVAAVLPSDAAVPPSDVIDLTSSIPEGDTAVEPMHITPEREPEAVHAILEPMEDASAEPSDSVMPPPVEREASVVSSEGADVARVQAMFSELTGPKSAASDPPSSAKSSSPPPQAPDMVDLPSLDERLFAADSSETVNAAFEASTSFQPGSDSERTSAPAPSNKVPLFLPSPSSSPVASSSSRGASRRASDDEDSLSGGEAAPRPLYGHRNKGKARQHSVNIGTISPGSGSQLSTRKSEVFIAVPPLPRYARQLREVEPTSASTSAGEESVDELAEWHEEEDRKTREEEMQATVQLAYDRMRESPCLWSGCGALLNSMSRLQEHAAQHASEHMEWGTYGCRWQNCTLKFAQEAKLAQHLRKHGRSPLPCTYDGCEKTFDTAEALLAHHKSIRHRNGLLRASTAPFPLAENRRPLSPLPDALPAHMSVPRRVSRHPISKERHQWLGPKVLENITAFKYSGGRSNAAQPPRGSRRLAEKVAAVELAGVSPEAALEQIKRWMDDEYLAFADGYDAARHPGLRCADVPSQEVTQLVKAGLVLWPAEDDQKAEARVHASGGQEERGGRGVGGRADKDATSRLSASAVPRMDASASGGDDGGANDGEDSGVDQLADDVSDGQGADVGGGGQQAGEKGEDAGGRNKLKFELPRLSKVGVVPEPGDAIGTVGVAVKHEDGASPDRRDGDGSASQNSNSQAEQHIPWPIWPPPPG